MSDNKLQKYFILTPPRVGGTWLCDMLWKTDVLGRPMEYYNDAGKTLAKKCAFKDVKCRKYTEFIIKSYTTSNNIFGSKGGALAVEVLKRHTDKNVKIVILERKDVIMQAISYQRMLEGDNIYDNAKLLEAYDRMCHVIGKCNQYCINRNITPLKIYYEDLCIDPKKEVTKIADMLNVDIKDCKLTSNVEITRTSESYEWKERFIQENLSIIDPEHLKYTGVI